MKILIIGFQRSGTSLLRRLFDTHPDVDAMLHEKRILNKPKKFKQFEENNYKIWGDKIPWNSPTGSEIIRYAKKWANQFSEYRIVHIIRHPIDVANSNSKLGWINFDESIKRSKHSVVKVHNALKEFNYTALCFEDLATKPEDILMKLFKFCQLDYSDSVISNILMPIEGAKKITGGLVLSSRAYAFRGEGKEYKKVNYNKLRNLIR